jgi:hypothetical protein
MLRYSYRKLMAPDAQFTHGDREIVVRLSVPSKLALLLETSLDDLAAALASCEKRIKTVALMFQDFLSESDHIVYFVMISLNAPVNDKTAPRLSREVDRWKTETQRWAAIRPHRKLRPRDT